MELTKRALTYKDVFEERQKKREGDGEFRDPCNPSHAALHARGSRSPKGGSRKEKGRENEKADVESPRLLV